MASSHTQQGLRDVALDGLTIAAKGKLEHMAESARRDREQTQCVLAQTFSLIEPVDLAAACFSAPPGSKGPHEEGGGGDDETKP
jgi:hypothetical protein